MVIIIANNYALISSLSSLKQPEVSWDVQRRAPQIQKALAGAYEMLRDTV